MDLTYFGSHLIFSCVGVPVDNDLMIVEITDVDLFNLVLDKDVKAMLSRSWLMILAMKEQLFILVEGCTLNQGILFNHVFGGLAKSQVPRILANCC